MENKVHVVDLRSDTLTLPTDKMRKAMSEAEVGDDVYGEDQTVNRLQRMIADICKKEDALFVPTGTMGNLLSVLSHCWERASEVMLGDESHIYLNEQGGIAQWGGVGFNVLRNKRDGTFSLKDARANFRDDKDPHRTKTSLIAVENAMNGRILPMPFLQELRVLANELGVPVHMDGARLFHAAVGLNVEPSAITKYVDSINICLSKGLGSPVGSVIVGSKELIGRARRLRKALGGGMRQCGVLAAAGIISLTDMVGRLHVDHDNAKKFAEGVLEYAPKYVCIDLNEVETNMVWIEVKNTLPTHDGRKGAAEFCHRMAQCNDGEDILVKVLPFTDVHARAVFHNGIAERDVDLGLVKLHSVMKAWIEECV